MTPRSNSQEMKPMQAESVLQHCFHANATPFVWDRSKPEEVALLKSCWRRLMVRSSQLITFANIPYLILGLRLKWKPYIENEMYVELTLHSLWLVFYCGCISMQVLFAKEEKHVCDVVNEIYKFVAVMESKFKRKMRMSK